MKLYKALDTMLSNDPDLPDSELQEARRITYTELQELATFVNAGVRDDVIQEVFLALHHSGTELNEQSDASARGLLRRSLANKEKTFYRKQKSVRSRRQNFKEQSSDANQSVRGDFSEFDLRSSVADSHELKEVCQNSSIIGDIDSADQIRTRLYDFLLEHVASSMISRSDAVERARQDIANMRALSNEKTTLEELVTEEVGDEADDDQRRRARNSLHTRHRRTRTRIKEWIEAREDAALKEELGCELSPFDRRLLLLTIRDMRLRRASDNG